MKTEEYRPASLGRYRLRELKYGYGSIRWMEEINHRMLIECLARVREERCTREGGQYRLPLWLPKYAPGTRVMLDGSLW
jgi:hypothetical protein